MNNSEDFSIFRYNQPMNDARKELIALTTDDISRDVNPALRDLQMKYALKSSSSAYRAHVYCTFNDGDFRKEADTLKSEIEELYYPHITFKTSYDDKHLLLDDKLSIADFADKYRITIEDAGFYLDGYFHSGYIEFGNIPHVDGEFKYIQPGETEDRLVYAIGAYTTLDDIRADWPIIEEYRKLQYPRLAEKRVKKRAPENPTLIYAIFKARSKGVTFPRIFSMYEKAELPGYSGSSSQYSHSKSLERYYRKYTPVKQYNRVLLRADYVI